MKDVVGEVESSGPCPQTCRAGLYCDLFFAESDGVLGIAVEERLIRLWWPGISFRVVLELRMRRSVKMRVSAFLRRLTHSPKRGGVAMTSATTLYTRSSTPSSPAPASRAGSTRFQNDR